MTDSHRERFEGCLCLNDKRKMFFNVRSLSSSTESQMTLNWITGIYIFEQCDETIFYNRFSLEQNTCSPSVIVRNTNEALAQMVRAQLRWTQLRNLFSRYSLFLNTNRCRFWFSGHRHWNCLLVLWLPGQMWRPYATWPTSSSPWKASPCKENTASEAHTYPVFRIDRDV